MWDEHGHAGYVRSSERPGHVLAKVPCESSNAPLHVCIFRPALVRYTTVCLKEDFTRPPLMEDARKAQSRPRAHHIILQRYNSPCFLPGRVPACRRDALLVMGGTGPLCTAFAAGCIRLPIQAEPFLHFAPAPRLTQLRVAFYLVCTPQGS